MRIPHDLLALAACLTLVSCATAPTAPDAPPPGSQPLLVRTDPPGATCSILQNGAVVASVAATPGTANVPRVFCRFCILPRPEELPPIEVVCRKEGYLESRMSFAVQWAHVVAVEEVPARDPSAADAVGAVAGVGAVAAMGSTQALAMAAAAAPMVVLPILAVGALVAGVAASERPPRYDYAYRALPEFLLTPATFASGSECDAYFASLMTRLGSARDMQRANIDAQCRFWPCKASDPAPCPDPVCERRRTIADEQLKSQLDRIPVLRAQVRIVAP